MRTWKKVFSIAGVAAMLLADLYAWEVKTLIPIRVDLPAKIRCYQIDAQREDNVWNVTVQGILNG